MHRHMFAYAGTMATASCLSFAIVSALAILLQHQVAAQPTAPTADVTPGVAKANKAVVLDSAKAVDGFCVKAFNYGPACNRKLPDYSLPTKRPKTIGRFLGITKYGLDWVAPPNSTPGAAGPKGDKGDRGPAGPSANLTSGSISATALATNSVTTRAILARSVTSSKIAVGAVTGSLRSVSVPAPFTTTAGFGGSAKLLAFTFMRVELGLLSTDDTKRLYQVFVSYRDGGISDFSLDAAIAFTMAPGAGVAPWIPGNAAVTVNCGSWIQVQTAATASSFVWRAAQPHRHSSTNFNRVAGSCSYLACATADGGQC